MKNKRMKTKKIVLIGILLSFVFSSCDRDRNDTGYAYFPDMAKSIAFETYSENSNFEDGKTNQDPVEGTVPMHMIPYQYKIDEREKAGLELKNMYELSNANLSRGKKMYNIFCIGCHGRYGEADGFLYTSGKYNYLPRSLVSETMMAVSVEEIYHVITHGYGLMGPHDGQILPEDRWKILLYIQHEIQKRD
jgi:Cytochrome C oxidase, cbb3-type, subunit III